MEALLHGMLLAFGLILPLGVQNVFIFNQGAVQSRYKGALPAILTAAICDTILILLAVGGVSVIIFRFSWIQNLFFTVGCLFLFYMGWTLWRTNVSPVKKEKATVVSAKRQVAFAASVSLLNPHAIMDTIGVIGTTSAIYPGFEKGLFAMGCVAVSWLWFFGLAFAGRKTGQLDTDGILLKKLNRVSAFIIWVLALYMAYQVLTSF
ncbi:lysine transporter LysE [Bacillus sp. FJAT-18017]|uniref:LysE/ArgO family amino acid transporter n=1 Tax=Bacillus sp. FJAT-18017 TaxID=1705566 RepID=UPI0006AFD5F8|nr:LysE/ArgO family amino acid transporter [Bacillus sp. FJAT-18017]ALC92223.1 lysine transporter LysE [Bacillus sp. FJAT-18017]